MECRFGGVGRIDISFVDSGGLFFCLDSRDLFCFDSGSSGSLLFHLHYLYRDLYQVFFYIFPRRMSQCLCNWFRYLVIAPD
jgi:hypothetical protein